MLRMQNVDNGAVRPLLAALAMSLGSACIAQNKPNPPSVVCANGQCANSPGSPANLQSPAADDACVPFAMATPATLFGSPRRVFAHYFYSLPLSIDNKPTASDYYSSKWLIPLAGNMWYQYGGYLRSRPIGIAPAPEGQDYKVRNLEIEIRTAIARGITGFTYDIGHVRMAEKGGDLLNMLEAANAADSRFKIVLMPDHLSANDALTVIKATYSNPALYRYNGKVVVAPYSAQTVSPQDWANMKATLASQNMPIFFLPTFHSINSAYLTQYGAVADGFGLFGTAQILQGKQETDDIDTVRAAGKPYMSGLAPQGYRPKDYIYYETQGSQGYRSGWMAEVTGLPEWIQLTTWNDYSETSQVSPFTDTHGAAGSGFYDLTGYYASWYATAKEPSITHDVIYYFYRRQSVHAPSPKAGKQTTAARDPGVDVIELVGLLTAPGTLSITAGGRTYTSDVGAGVQSFSVPLAPGVPTFSLTRNGTIVASLVGDQTIAGSSGLPGGFADFTYWTGSASSAGLCTINGALK